MANNSALFFNSILKNKILLGIIASTMMLLTIGLFKSIKPPPTPPENSDKANNNNDNKNDKNNKNNNNNKNNSNNKESGNNSKKEEDEFLQDLKKEINNKNNDKNNKNNNNKTNINNKNNNISNKVDKSNPDYIFLPHQVLYQIFEHISPEDFLNCSVLNKKWNQVISKLDKCWFQFSFDRWNIVEETTLTYKESFKKKFLEEKKRLGFKPNDYIITIHSECADFTEPGRWLPERIINPKQFWKKRFLEELSKYLTMTAFMLNNEEENEEEEEEEEEEANLDNKSVTGTIVLKGKINTVIGVWRFINKEDAQLKFKGQKWLEKHWTAEDCQFTGDVVGYFNFSLFPLASDDEIFQQYKSPIIEFLRLLTYGTRGTLTRLKTGYGMHSIVYEQCKLKSVFGKYGMNDGDALLDTSLESNYIIQLIEEIQNFLDKRGIGVNSDGNDGSGAKVTYTDRTSHNPIRCTGHLPDEALQLEIGIWIYNGLILSNKKLWNRKLED
ncbi:hypothetical protein DICPUDRAFT_94994 [Dictyostelium purpureum]|uniref:F-box domain-containing protein n=1 Tax=Dictyostelium purpureum TaxID=5786 RepID=F0ZQX3_DICPU|nr:uncharacterized protein DICPUDRAFT_94994 [Dictyostelium purpureum]EGC33655.1 hypothetical protein DICPUDRAFT_94994 [Dictyostelium purpureum]|eukprot:XP_003289825.1 hypothetical protein DICPUDRAFT_94994 [Dictyostelium purpureum]